MTDAPASRALTKGLVAVAALGGVVWLLALGLFAHHVATVGSPPRVAAWDGPAEDENLPVAAFLAEDEAWLLRQAVDRPLVVRVDLARGVAETGWDLSMLGPETPRLEGVARRDDGALTLVVMHHGLVALTLQRDRSVQRHGSVRLDPSVAVIGVVWVGETLHAALSDGRSVAWRDGSAAIEPIAGCPPIEHPRDLWLAAARWTAGGWDVLLWERPGRWRWTLGGTGAPAWAASYGGLSHRFAPFDEPVHVGAPGLGPPPSDEVRPRLEPGSALRATGAGTWENASAAGGFWDWCLPHGERWLCVSHDATSHRTELFDGEGHRTRVAVHERFAPADPVVVDASGGGVWVLDLSNTSEDGRIYYRLTGELARADALDARERYERARPRTRAEARAWQATSGPSAMFLPTSPEASALGLFFLTVALPISLFSYPAALLVVALTAAALRLAGRGAARAVLVLLGLQLLLALVTLPRFVHLLAYV